MSALTLEAISRPLLSILLDSMVRGMIVLLAVGGAALLMKQRSAAARYRLWLVAIIATVLMPMLVLLPGWHVLPARPADAVVASDGISAPVAREIVRVDAGDASRAAPPASASARSTPTPTLAATPAARAIAPKPVEPLLPKLLTVLFDMWALGAVAMGGRLLLSRASLASLARHAQPASGELRSLLQSAASQLSCRRRIRLLQSTQPAVMPMTWGLFRPTILLPQAFDEWAPSRQRIVLLHELSHTKHVDYLWILLAEISAAIFWFNPVWRWAVNQFRDEAERSCDELVVYAGEDRFTYASELVATVRGYAQNRRATALALAMSRCSTLEARLQLILKPGVPPQPRGAVAAAIVALLVIAPLSQIRLSASVKPAASPQTNSFSTARSSDGRLGGTVVDALGNPIAGAVVHTSWNPRGIAENKNLDSTTDRFGVWTVDPDPTLDLRSVIISHEGFVTLMVPQIDRRELVAGSRKFLLVRGVIVRGIVLDDNQIPVAGARLFNNNAPMSYNTTVDGISINSPKPVLTAVDGSFVFTDVSPTLNQLLVLAKDYAPQVQKLDLSNPDTRYSIQLSRGVTITGIVIGPDNEPAVGVSVTASNWVKSVGLNRHAITDKDGHFAIPNIPTGATFSLMPFKMSAAPVSIEATARSEPYVLNIVDFAKMKLTVLDDATGEPMKEFGYSATLPSQDPDALNFLPVLRQRVQSNEGVLNYEARATAYHSPTQRFQLRVGAPGYLTADSPVFMAGTPSEATIRLVKSLPLDGTVVDPTGAPAPNTQLAWIRPGRKAFLNANATLDSQFVEAAESVVKTDGVGRFRDFQRMTTVGKIIAVGPAGFALVDGDQLTDGGTLKLQPWSRIEGSVQWHDQAVANDQVFLQGTYANGVVQMFMNGSTNSAGNYAFDYVLPAHVTVQGGRGGKEKPRIEIDLQPGVKAVARLTHVD